MRACHTCDTTWHKSSIWPSVVKPCMQGVVHRCCHAWARTWYRHICQVSKKKNYADTIFELFEFYVFFSYFWCYNIAAIWLSLTSNLAHPSKACVTFINRLYSCSAMRPCMRRVNQIHRSPIWPSISQQETNLICFHFHGLRQIIRDQLSAGLLLIFLNGRARASFMGTQAAS